MALQGQARTSRTLLFVCAISLGPHAHTYFGSALLSTQTDNSFNYRRTGLRNVFWACGTVAAKPQLLKFFERAAQDGGPNLTVATDGSSRDGVGAFEIVCDDPPTQIEAADQAEDQSPTSPFRMELLALMTTFTCGSPVTARQQSGQSSDLKDASTEPWL